MGTTKRLSRQRADNLQKDQARKDQQRKLESRIEYQRTGEGLKVMDWTGLVVTSFFLVCQSAFAGISVMLLIMSTVSDDFLVYYAPMANTCRQIVVFLSSLCILAALEKHSQDAVLNFDPYRGASYGRSVGVITLYSLCFVLSLVNTPMDDTLASTHARIPSWYTYAMPSSKFQSDLDVWRVLNVIRLLAAILAWAVLASDARNQPMPALIDYGFEFRREKPAAEPVEPTSPRIG